MRATRALQMFRPTARMMRPVPKEDQSAHTISQRLRKLKSIPPELIPLGVVVAFAVGAAFYSSMRHFFVDKTLRLKRQNRASEKHEHASSHGDAEHN
ncbi:hypothetical protein B0T24DRAFT_243811 [Lasiosphaeria ovina]|uniref:NADH-ubiquinone reductase complex 1 MLRQ subunit n=1 Tax=Lasiosphaeria ovina TaxID=92902 RepID=A0AAE0KB10_9PEZI|nr:hypothetical protein B0T24DRAFT_243811 [Lasiosphaeria ovina]